VKRCRHPASICRTRGCVARCPFLRPASSASEPLPVSTSANSQASSSPRSWRNDGGIAAAPIIQCLSYGSTSRLYLSRDGQYIGREGVRCFPVCRDALCLRIPNVGDVSRSLAISVEWNRRDSKAQCEL
jgi:hypothetical protein